MRMLFTGICSVLGSVLALLHCFVKPLHENRPDTCVLQLKKLKLREVKSFQDLYERQEMQQFLPHVEAWAPHPFILFFERQRGDGGEKSSNLLPQKPTTAWAGGKTQTGNSIQVFPVSGKDPST